MRRCYYCGKPTRDDICASCASVERQVRSIMTNTVRDRGSISSPIRFADVFINLPRRLTAGNNEMICRKVWEDMKRSGMPVTG